MFKNLKYKKIISFLVILLIVQNQVLAGVNIVSKTLGNTTTYYLNNKAILLDVRTITTCLFSANVIQCLFTILFSSNSIKT